MSRRFVLCTLAPLALLLLALILCTVPQPTAALSLRTHARSAIAVTHPTSRTLLEEVSSSSADAVSSSAEASSSAAESSSSSGSDSSSTADASGSSSTAAAPVVRPSEDDTKSIVTTVLTVIGVLAGVICLERLYSSCRRTWKRRQGREGFSELQQPDGGNGFNPDLTHDELQLTNVRGGDDQL